MSDKNNSQNDAYNELLKNFSQQKNSDPLSGQAEDDVKNNGEIYFSANASSQRPETPGIPFFGANSAPAANGVPFSSAHKSTANRRTENMASARTKKTGGNAKALAARNTTKKASGKKGGKRKPDKNVLNLFSVLAVVAFVLIVSLFIKIPIMGCINDVFAMDRSSTELQVIVDDGMKVNDIIDLLKSKDLIYSSAFCKLATSFFDYDKDKPVSGGTYHLSPDMGIEGMLNEILSAGVKTSTVTLTFPEGFTVDQYVEKLSSNGVASAKALYTVMNSDEFFEKYDFLKPISDRDQRYRALEGYLYPDTYEFYVGEDPTSVLDRFLTNFNNKWSEKYTSRAEELGMTIDEIVTIASILEKEAYDAEQMPLIASVLYNRLRSSSFPYINCDSTAKYLDSAKDELTQSGTYNSYIALYDTYQKTGLPISAISNPGADAIHAALYPDSTDYYYFLHAANGKIYMARTAQEHEENQKYLDE